MSRRSGLALLAAGATCLLSAGIPLVSAHAEDPLGSGLGSYAMYAAAPGIELKVGEPTYCFVTPAGLNGCEGVIPEATSQLQNGPIGSATAAIAWPGSLAANAGSLLITAGGSSVPPQATMLNDPVKAEVKTGSTPDTVTNTTVPNVVMKAVAKPLSTSANASISDVSASAVGTFGSVKGVTDTSVTGASKVTSKAMSQVSDISLLAGVVHIGGVTSTAEATSDGVKATVKGKTEVSDVTIAGFPVTIDEHGVSVQGSGLALSTATAAVSSALKSAGLTLLVSELQGKPVGPDVTYTSGSLVLAFKQMAYSVTLTLGGANVIASAGPGFGYTGGTTTPVVNPGGGTVNPGTTNPGTTTPGTLPSIGGGTVPAPITEGGTVVPPTTSDPVLVASRKRLGAHGVSPWLVAFGLLGSGLVLAGMRRLPDRVLEATAPVCPLEETA